MRRVLATLAAGLAVAGCTTTGPSPEPAPSTSASTPAGVAEGEPGYRPTTAQSYQALGRALLLRTGGCSRAATGFADETSTAVTVTLVAYDTFGGQPVPCPPSIDFVVVPLDQRLGSRQVIDAGTGTPVPRTKRLAAVVGTSHQQAVRVVGWWPTSNGSTVLHVRAACAILAASTGSDGVRVTASTPTGWTGCGGVDQVVALDQLPPPEGGALRDAATGDAVPQEHGEPPVPRSFLYDVATGTARFLGSG